MGEALAATKNYKRLLPLYLVDLRLGRKANTPVDGSFSLFATLRVLMRQKAGLPRPKCFIAVRSKPTSAADHIYGESDTLIRIGHLQARRGKYPEATRIIRTGRTL